MALGSPNSSASVVRRRSLGDDQDGSPGRQRAPSEGAIVGQMVEPLMIDWRQRRSLPSGYVRMGVVFRRSSSFNYASIWS